MNRSIDNIIKQHGMAQRLSNESVKSGVERLDLLLAAEASEVSFADVEFLRRSRYEAAGIMARGYRAAKCSVLIPAGLWGLSSGLGAPDLDISLLGIGNHRFFVFHSAMGLVALRYLYKRWWATSVEPHRFTSRAARKITGTALGAYAMGVGVHLAIDVFQPKSVVFPFFGSLVNGTLVDDNVWLLGNSLWAFRIGHEMFALSIAGELETARDYVKARFAPLRNNPKFPCDRI